MQQEQTLEEQQEQTLEECKEKNIIILYSNGNRYVLNSFMKTHSLLFKEILLDETTDVILMENFETEFVKINNNELILTIEQINIRSFINDVLVSLLNNYITYFKLFYNYSFF